MALTRDFKQTIQDRVNRDADFAPSMLKEAMELILAGDSVTARLMLRDLVNATISFEGLASATSLPVKSLHRMLSVEGNPSMTNLTEILKALQVHLKVSLQVGRERAYGEASTHPMSVSEKMPMEYGSKPQTQEFSAGSNQTEVRGQWWFSDKPKDQVPGTLRLNGDRMTLSLDGLLGSHSRRELLDERYVIHGIDTSTRRWTLTRAFEHQMNPAFFGGPKTSGFIVGFAFEGAHLESDETLEVSTASVSLTNLNLSLGKSGLEVKHHDADTIDVGYKKPPGFIIDIPQIGGSLEVVRSWTGSFEWYSAQLKSSSRIELQYSSPTLFSTVSDHMFGVANLISLLHSVPATLEEVQLVTANDELVVLRFSQKASSKSTDSTALLVSLSALSECLPEVVNNWFNLSAQALTAINVFCNLCRNPAPFGQSDFTQYVQTLESLHRSISDHEYLPKSQFKNLVVTPLKEAIEACEVSSELRENLVSQVKFANQLSQRTRLQQLYESLPPELAHLLAVDAVEFLSKVVHTRNYLTHLDADYKRKSMHGDEIPFATAGLKLFFIFSVLTRLGVPTDLILANLPRTLLFRTLKHAAPW